MINDLFVYVLVVGLFISLLFNAFQYSRSKRRRESVELQEFLHDLTRSGGLVLVKRVAAEDVLIRQRRL